MTDQRLLAEHVVTPGGVLHSAMIIISDGSISEIRPFLGATRCTWKS